MPHAFLVVPAVLVSGVLLLSGLAKVREPQAGADAFVNLRLPAWLLRIKAPLLLPYGEIALALLVLLCPAPIYQVAVIAAALLMIAYLLVIARALTFEEPVECGCFGRLGVGAIDRLTLARNALLLVLAGIAVADSFANGSLIARLVRFGTEQWGWLTAIAVTAVVAGFIVRGKAAPQPLSLADFDELDYVPQPIPYGVLHEVGDPTPVTLRELAQSKPTLLAFVSMTCGPCIRTMKALPQWAQDHPIMQVVAVPARSPQRDALPDLGPHVRWMYDPDDAVDRLFGPGWPVAVLLGANGELAGGPVLGFDDIEGFLADISAELASADSVETGGHE